VIFRNFDKLINLKNHILKKNLLLIVITILSLNTINAQIEFEEILANPAPDIINNFGVIGNSNFAYNDVDNDNDLDVMMSGYVNGQKVVLLYLNDGNGNYTLDTTTNFIDVNARIFIFGDVDGDNDDDVLISGTNNSNTFLVNLYLNDGNGNFTLDTNTNFEIVFNGNDSAFGDIDNDNDLDLIIGDFLYTNDGNGNFNLVSNPFNGTANNINFVDVDNDNDLDLMMNITNGTYNAGTKLYRNDGNGNFTLDENQNFIILTQGDIEFGDIDNDNDLDVLITGTYLNDNIYYSKLYRNDGNGIFILDEGSNISILEGNATTFSDFDLDGDLDLIMSGDDDPSNNGPINGVTQIYINDGTGYFTENQTTIFSDYGKGTFISLDIDNDNDNDIILNLNFPQIFVNDGFGEFELVIAKPFEELNFCAIDFADIDGDNDLDMLIAGETDYILSKTQLYSNDGNGNYTLIPNTPFEDVKYGNVTFVDIDNDLDQDVVISGNYILDNIPNNNISRLYLNDGSGNFSLDQNSALNFDVEDGSTIMIHFADIDNDNDQDAIVTGYINTLMTISNLYINDGAGNFNIDLNNPFTDIAFGDLVITDLDNDNDPDVFYNGRIVVGSELSVVSKKYFNDGNGNFQVITDSNIEKFEYRTVSISFADIDDDTDNDLIISGELERINGQFIGYSTQLYTNDGSGNFTIVSDTPFINVYNGDVAFADVDNDNDQDVLITGTNIDFERVIGLYENDGSGDFTVTDNLPFFAASSSDIAFADVDNDTDLDVLISGYNGSRKSTKLFRNQTILNIDDHNKSSKYILYPNPTTGKVHWANFQNESTLTARISTIEGRLIKQVTLSENNNFSFEVNGTKGIYIVELISGKSKEVYKIIKN